MVRIPWRGVPKEEEMEIEAPEAMGTPEPYPLRVAFEKWARGIIGFKDFEVKDENADSIELEYCDDDVEVAWCAFVEGALIGGWDV